MRRAGLDQATVIQAAAELADTVGLEKVTLGDVAAQLGVRTPSLYNHVAGLAGLQRELTLLGLHELSRRLGRAVMGKAKDEAIWALAWAYRDFVKEHPGLYTATVRAGDPEDAEQQAAAKEVPQPTIQFRRRAWLEFQRALDPLARPKPFRIRPR